MSSRFEKDDPWAMAKFIGTVHREETAVEKAKENAQALKDRGLHPDRFTAYKVSLCGGQHRRDYLPGLTKEQIDNLPLGRQSDAVGSFIWAYGINGGTNR